MERYYKNGVITEEGLKKMKELESIAEDCNWHLASTISGIIHRLNVNRQEAEELAGWVFETHALITDDES